MTLTLAKTDLSPMLEQRVIRMEADTRAIQRMSIAEIRAVYANIETMRDVLSQLLDKADGK